MRGPITPKASSMKRPKRPAAETTAALANALPRHPLRDAFLEAAARLLAADVRNAAEPEAPLTEEEALTGARSEFAAGLLAMAFDPAEDRFLVVWASPAWSRLLKPYLTNAWLQSPGTYGQQPPTSYDPKRNPSNLH